MNIHARTVSTALAVSAVAFGVLFVLLNHGGIFWQGSVSQLHADCSVLGPYVAIGGQRTVNACSEAATAYTLLIAGLVVTGLTVAASLAYMVLHRNNSQEG